MTSDPSKARETILTKLRNAAADPESLFRGRAEPRTPTSVPSGITSAVGSGLELAHVFGENLNAVLGSYEVAEDPADVAARIAARIGSLKEEHQGSDSYGAELLSWEPDEMPIPHLARQLEGRGISLFVPSDLGDREQRTHAATLPIGLTGVDAAFAGTGSMVFIPGPGKSRSASLLPLHHIALVPFSRIFPTLECWLADLRNDGETVTLFRNHSQLVFITGPSKSADIELNLTLGVHGPRDVHAILMDDSR